MVATRSTPAPKGKENSLVQQKANKVNDGSLSSRSIASQSSNTQDARSTIVSTPAPTRFEISRPPTIRHSARLSRLKSIEEKDDDSKLDASLDEAETTIGHSPLAGLQKKKPPTCTTPMEICLSSSDEDSDMESISDVSDEDSNVDGSQQKGVIVGGHVLPDVSTQKAVVPETGSDTMRKEDGLVLYPKKEYRGIKNFLEVAFKEKFGYSFEEKYPPDMVFDVPKLVELIILCWKLSNKGQDKEKQLHVRNAIYSIYRRTHLMRRGFKIRAKMFFISKSTHSHIARAAREFREEWNKIETHMNLICDEIGSKEPAFAMKTQVSIPEQSLKRKLDRSNHSTISKKPKLLPMKSIASPSLKALAATFPTAPKAPLKHRRDKDYCFRKLVCANSQLGLFGEKDRCLADAACNALTALRMPVDREDCLSKFRKNRNGMGLLDYMQERGVSVGVNRHVGAHSALFAAQDNKGVFILEVKINYGSGGSSNHALCLSSLDGLLIDNDSVWMVEGILGKNVKKAGAIAWRAIQEVFMSVKDLKEWKLTAVYKLSAGSG